MVSTVWCFHCLKLPLLGDVRGNKALRVALALICHYPVLCICLLCELDGSEDGCVCLNAWVLRDGVGIVLIVTGTLRGYDQLMNLVIDETQEHLRGENVEGKHRCSAGYIVTAGPEDC